MTQPLKTPALTIAMHGDWEVTTTENTLTIRFRNVTPAIIEPTVDLTPQHEPATESNITDYSPAPNIKPLIDQWIKSIFVIDSQNRDEHIINDLANEFAQYRLNRNDPTAYNPHTLRTMIGKWAADRPSVYTRQIKTGNKNKLRVIIGLRRRKHPLPTQPDKASNRIDFNT